MPASRASITRIRSAERPGKSGYRGEDRIFLAPTAAIILDGASQPELSERDGGWLADTLGSMLSERLTTNPAAELSDLVADTIATVARKNRLTPGLSPSTTVSIVRWDSDSVDAFALGDSPIIALTANSRLLKLRDDRLSRVATHRRRAFEENNGGIFGTDRPQEWQELVEAERRMRNKNSGYWIAEAVPDAAHHAFLAKWATRDIAAIMVTTDGVANGVDRYGVPETWHDALSIARHRPSDLLDLVHDAEESDARAVRWPRSKCHDDKALVLVEFTGP